MAHLARGPPVEKHCHWPKGAIQITFWADFIPPPNVTFGDIVINRLKVSRIFFNSPKQNKPKNIRYNKV